MLFTRDNCVFQLIWNHFILLTSSASSPFKSRGHDCEHEQSSVAEMLTQMVLQNFRNSRVVDTIPFFYNLSELGRPVFYCSAFRVLSLIHPFSASYICFEVFLSPFSVFDIFSPSLTWQSLDVSEPTQSALTSRDTVLTPSLFLRSVSSYCSLTPRIS
jgi:hypothetical protein